MSSPMPTPSSASSTPSNLDLILGVSLVIPGLILVGFVIFYTLNLKRGRATKDEDYIEDSHGHVLDRRHPAAKVTPFANSRLDMPRFGHKPGSDMRIAIRRPDGGWQFSSPRSSRFPAPGLDNTAPSSPSSTLYPFSSPGNALGSPNLNIPRTGTHKTGSNGPQKSQAWQRFFTKEQEAKVASERRNEMGYGYSEYDLEAGVEVPPPAYHGHDR